MMFDLLSDILANLRFEASSYFCSEFSGRWGIAGGSGCHGEFHILLRGRAWLSVGGAEPQVLQAGDIVLLPRGRQHTLAAEPGAALVDGATLVSELQGGVNRFSGPEADTTLICGRFQTRRLHHPFLNSLPDMIHIGEASSPMLKALRHVVQTLAAELQLQPMGAALVRDRLTEVLIIQLLRIYILEQQPGDFLAALSDRQISRALTLMHRDITRPWTVELLGQEVGMSRSAFSDRFHQLVGVPPMSYLLNWRMQRAQVLLQESGCSMLDIAEQTGYASEASFGKAFKRVYGISPGLVRRQHLADGGTAGS